MKTFSRIKNASPLLCCLHNLRASRKHARPTASTNAFLVRTSTQPTFQHVKNLHSRLHQHMCHRYSTAAK